MNRVQLNSQVSQGSAATDLRWGGRFYVFGWCIWANSVNKLLHAARDVRIVDNLLTQSHNKPRSKKGLRS